MEISNPSPETDSNDEQHLRMLSIFYYVMAAFDVLGLIVLGIQLLFVFAFTSGGPQPEAMRPFGAVFMLFILVLMGINLVMIVGNLLIAMLLPKRRNYTACMVVAGATCLMFPLGTVLGVFTILVLMRPSVQQSFDHGY
ncbi:hypothetical protein [Bremerella cremea]|uniref:hypothetical protein n=1 Tax=Bremerella cremea TaxID=1031537 RepID=UPI0031E5BFC6